MTQRLEAFADLRAKLPAKRAFVLETIRSQAEVGATLADLVRLTGWAINRLSGRVSELARAEYLREAGVRGGQTIWVACLPREGAAVPRKLKTVQARVERVEEPDIFGRIRILVSVPAGVSVGALKTTSTIPLKL